MPAIMATVPSQQCRKRMLHAVSSMHSAPRTYIDSAAWCSPAMLWILHKPWCTEALSSAIRVRMATPKHC